MIAGDTRNIEFTKSLLRSDYVTRYQARAYEPRSLSTPVGVIRGADLQLDITAIQTQIRSTAPITHVRRLAETYLCMTLASAKLRQHVILRYDR